MIALLCFFLNLLASLFKSEGRLEAENTALRHQLIVLRRKVRGRVHLTNGDRLFFDLVGDGLDDVGTTFGLIARNTVSMVDLEPVRNLAVLRPERARRVQRMSGQHRGGGDG